MAAYDGLNRLGMIEETARGYFDHSTLQGNLTRYVARDELLERLLELEGHPALLPPYDKDAEIIILRDKIDGKKIVVSNGIISRHASQCRMASSKASTGDYAMNA